MFVRHLASCARALAPKVILVAFASLAFMPARAGALPRLVVASERYREVFVHFDTLRAKGAGDEIDRWLAELAASPAALADSDLRIVVDAHRAAQFGLRGRREDAQRLAASGIARGAATRDTLLLCRALLSHALGDVIAGDARMAAPVVMRLLAASRAARLPRYEGQARLDQAYIDLLALRGARSERGYRAALQLLSPSLDAGMQRVARVGLGRALVLQRRIEEARAELSSVIRESRAARDDYNLAVALNNLASLELQYGDPVFALPAYQQALELHRRLGRADEQLLTLCNLSRVHMRLQEMTEAERTLESGRPLLAERLRPATRAEFHALLGAILREHHRSSESDEQFRQAWAVTDSFHLLPQVVLVAERAGELGRAGRVDEAIRLLERRLADVPANLPTVDADRLQLGNAAAALMSEAGDHAAAQARWLALLREVEAAGSQQEVLYFHAMLAQDRQKAGDLPGARRDVLAAMHAAMLGGFGTEDPQWRARTDVVGLFFWGEYVALLARPLPGEDASARTRVAFDAYHRLEARSGDRATSRIKPVSLASLQEGGLRRGEMLFEIVPGGDSSVVFAVTRARAECFRVEGMGTGLARIRRFLALAQQTGDETESLRSALAHELGRSLLGPLGNRLTGVRRLLVIEGGGDHQYPWPLLVAPDRPQPLVDRLETVTITSVAALVRARNQAASGPARVLAVLASSHSATGRTLKGVEQEARWLRERYADCTLDSPRSRADIAGGIAHLSAADVVHVSAHFATDPENPWRSGILLGERTRADSYLRVPELLRLRLRARLAVLTGCTAVQSDRLYSSGDRGIASAFLLAGARAVVGSRWPVRDEDGTALVRALYPALERGLPVAEALRQAQLALRRERATADPVHWAGFTVLGDPEVTAKLPRRRLFGMVP